MESYKEKYEQALRVAKKTYDKQPMYREWLEKMFPELKESEGADVIAEMQKEWSEEDETTLNSILSCIKRCLDKDTVAWYLGKHLIDLKRYDPMFDWLESLKQRIGG